MVTDPENFKPEYAREVILVDEEGIAGKNNPFSVSLAGVIDPDNSTATPLTASAPGDEFTGVWKKITQYSDVVTRAKADQDGLFKDSHV